MKFLIVSGLSGAGKSRVAKLLEDMGFYCVDNMPPKLLPRFAELCLASQGQYNKVALVTDVRAGHSFDELFLSLDHLREMECDYRIVFVEATAEIILKRYKETRRRHPMAIEGETLAETIAREGLTLEPVRSRADYIVNTSVMTSNQLRDHLEELFGSDESTRTLMVMVNSFGFKYGLPSESDLVFDVRFLPNPYHVQELRKLTGLDEDVSAFIHQFSQTQEFVGLLTSFVSFLLPQYVEEGKTSLVISVGCTGGRHRSVAIACELGEHISRLGYPVTLTHRDIARG